MRTALLLVGAALLFQALPASAAERDCTKAKGAYDKAICADPDLLQLDQDLAAAYDKLAATVSPAGAAQVRRNEKGRHAYFQELCRPDDPPCLAVAYRQSLASLAKFADQPAGGAFVPVERYRLSLPRVSVLSAFPSLDHPAEPWATSFEKAAHDAVDALLPDGQPADTTIDYRPTYLAPDLAAVAFSVRIYPDALAHRVAFNYLPAAQRTLQATDLFQSGTTWSLFLATRALTGLQEQAKADHWDLTVSGPGELEKPIADPTNWLIHPGGFGLYFAPGSVGTAGHEVLIPWAELMDYLSPTPAFAIPAP